MLATVNTAAKEIADIGGAVAVVAINVEDHIASIRAEHAKFDALRKMLRDVALT